MIRKITLLSLKLVVVLGCTQALNAQQIYTNGPLSTGATSNSGLAAPAGYTWSECQNETGNTTESNTNAGYGALFNTAETNSLQLADDFIVPVGEVWNVSSFDFFGYKTGYVGTTIPMDELRIEIYNVDPSLNPTAVPLFGDMTTNVLDEANSADANMYRIFNSAVPNAISVPGTTRKIWRYRGNITATLPEGTYWVVFQMHDAANVSGFMPPVTISGSRGLPTFNAKQNTIASTAVGAVLGWVDVIDSGTPVAAPDFNQDMPFLVNGTITLGVNENDFERMIASPNPVKDFLNLSNTHDIKGIEVYTMLGQKVISQSTNAAQSQVDMSQLAPGTYMVKVMSDNQQKTIKVVKQ